jgi:hypothetical protein
MTDKLYDTDLYAWTLDQAGYLRGRQWEALDINNLAEEIESLGNEQEHAVESHLANLLLHLLKMAYQHQRRLSWVRSVNNARHEIARRLRRSPSLRPKLPQLVTWAYPDARKDAAREARLPRETFPETCPWPLEQLLDDDFFPEESPPQ